MTRLFAALLLTFALASTSLADGECVFAEDAVQAWEAVTNRNSGGLSRDAVFANCAPCKCGDDRAACYEYRAVKERAKQAEVIKNQQLLSRALKYGICQGSEK